MTEEQLKEATFLTRCINDLKKEIKKWNEGESYKDSYIEIYGNSDTLSVPISVFIPFKDLKEMALERLNAKLDDYNKRFNDL